MKKLILLSMILLLTEVIYAKPLELRPLLQDRFEKNCAIRQQYDFHNDDNELTEPLKRHTTKSSYVDKNVYDSSVYQVQNVSYAGIPIRKMEFSFGRLAQQFNEYLYFDLSSESAKKKFKTLKFKQNHQKSQVSVEYKKNLAIVQCYWLLELN
ncbi:hypothetical protein RFY44_14825 [Acinetobacter bereziniae]|uniref:hypothetical protein n=1 Tax=Acinetobacter bereziniae TaxID=106648 RepID=UPI00125FFC35|nr:hypothetical protein [Acinetobacter bereziniae]MBJ9949610.1 hypothetical protein [Acinetobacter bereziniae]MCM8511743.1 hypothetical protein [Acinetobacter bereziniae]MCU4417816.1 hypothetical protein [Acinetobacter bereziniae]MDQ9820132.1 hypothetical protein [Acinetobacter bereziniae]